MRVASAMCAFCGAAGQLVPVPVVDEHWSRGFGAPPVVALDHGWYRSCRGPVAVSALSPAKLFSPHARVLCDYCAHGWAEDVRTRARPAVLALAERRSPRASQLGEGAALVRWAVLTAVLSDLLDGMSSASTPLQRDALRRGVEPSPEITTCFFSTSQRLPARVHLSQVRADSRNGDQGVVQIVSIELAHLTTLVVLPSDDVAVDIVRRSALSTDLSCPATAGPMAKVMLRPLDLARDPHPHRLAVHRLCAASPARAR